MNAEPVNAPRRQRGYADMTWWDPHVENITDTETYLRRKFRQDVTDKFTGISQKAMHARLAEIGGRDTHHVEKLKKSDINTVFVDEISVRRLLQIGRNPGGCL